MNKKTAKSLFYYRFCTCTNANIFQTKFTYRSTWTFLLFLQARFGRTPTKIAMGIKPIKTPRENPEGNLKSDCSCGLSFANSSQLFFHQTKFDHFVDYCALCDKKYSSVAKLKRHIESLHAGSEFYCEVCGRKFNRIDNLKAHEHLVHGINKCRACAAVFQTKPELKLHLIEIHGSRK